MRGARVARCAAGRCEKVPSGFCGRVNNFADWCRKRRYFKKTYLMAENIKSVTVAEEAIISKICLIRGQKVMIDRDLAELYGVETKQLKRQVRRNIDRFPEDFMFELSEEEFQEWRSQFGTSNEGDKMGLRYAPYVFTEQGVAMLSSVLNSESAIKVNIQIMNNRA